MLKQFAERLAEEGNLNPRHDRVYVIEEFDEPDHSIMIYNLTWNYSNLLQNEWMNLGL